MTTIQDRFQQARIEPDPCSPHSLLPGFAEPRWYVAQTCARHEKRVAEHLGCRGIEYLLPLYEKVSRWKDRRVHLQLPLFAGYIFVRLPLCERLRVLQVPSITRLVGFGGMPVPVPAEEIRAVQSGLASRVQLEPHPFLTVGRHVQIKSGPLAGFQGILLRKKGSYRLVLSVELIQRSIAVDVDASDIDVG